MGLGLVISETVVPSGYFGRCPDTPVAAMFSELKMVTDSVTYDSFLFLSFI